MCLIFLRVWVGFSIFSRSGLVRSVIRTIVGTRVGCRTLTGTGPLAAGRRNQSLVFLLIVQTHVAGCEPVLLLTDVYTRVFFR